MNVPRIRPTATKWRPADKETKLNIDDKIPKVFTVESRFYTGFQAYHMLKFE
jgi:hypothetical protein